MTQTARRLVCAAAALGLAPAASTAWADKIDTDRPDFVESSAVVGKGRFQLETSLAGEHDNAGGLQLRSLSTPTLLRLGVSENIELRVESDAATWTSSFDPASGVTTKDHGWADTAIGVKWHTRDGDEQAGTPSTAWLLHAELDSGSAPYRGQGVRPSLRWVAEWELPGEWSVGAMPGVFADRNDAGQRYWGGIAAVTTSKSWSEAFRTFFEIAAQRIAHHRDGGSVVTFDTGGAYLVNDSVQLDLGVFLGISRDAPNVAWTTGFSVKF